MDGEYCPIIFVSDLFVVFRYYVSGVVGGIFCILGFLSTYISMADGFSLLKKKLIMNKKSLFL